MAESTKTVTSDNSRIERRDSKIGKARELVGSAIWYTAGISVAAAVSVLLQVTITAESFGSVPRTATYVTVVVLVTFGLIYFFVLVLKQRTAHVSRLKQEVTGAFRKALDQSSFNPRRLEEKNEQSSTRATG